MAGKTSTEIDVRQVAGVVDMWTPEQVDLLRRTVAPGASDDEAALFLRVAQSLDLNPFLKEVWCVKQLDQDGNPKRNRKGEEYPAQIMVGRDGFLTIAERSGQFNGLVSGVVKAGDRFEFGLQQPVHVLGEERGKIMGAYAYVYRKDRDYPMRIFAEWSEHGAPITRDSEGKRINLWSPWSKTPSLMIKKVAESNALKLAFRVSGVVAADSPEEEIVDAEVVEDHPRPVGYSAETGAAPKGQAAADADATPRPSEEPDVSPSTGAGSVPVPAADEPQPEMFPPSEDELEREAADYQDPAA